MTVRELIVALTKCDPDAETGVYVQDDQSPDDIWLIAGTDAYPNMVVLVADEDQVTALSALPKEES